MKLFDVFLKTFRERSREIWLVALTVFIAPFFIFIYWLMTYAGEWSYDLTIVNEDSGVVLVDKTEIFASEEIVHLLETNADSTFSQLNLTFTPSMEKAQKNLRDKKTDGILYFPSDFSQSASDPDTKPSFTLYGDATSVYYPVTAILAVTVIDEYLIQKQNMEPYYEMKEVFIGGSISRTEFELYVPGLFVTAIIFLLVEISMFITREMEAGTLHRLKLTRMTAFDFLGGISIAYLVFEFVQIVISLLTAKLLGFRFDGTVGLVVLVALGTVFSTIAFGMIVASFVKTESEAFIVSNFPLFLLIFFTGGMMPMPDTTLFTVSGVSVAAPDVLPPTHAINAINKILIHGAGMADIAWDLFFLGVLTVIYFAIALALFSRKLKRLSL